MSDAAALEAAAHGTAAARASGVLLPTKGVGPLEILRGRRRARRGAEVDHRIGRLSRVRLLLVDLSLVHTDVFTFRADVLQMNVGELRVASIRFRRITEAQRHKVVGTWSRCADYRHVSDLCAVLVAARKGADVERAIEWPSSIRIHLIV